MAIRLFVHASNIRASVEFDSPKVVAPAFQRASVSISGPTYQTVVTYTDLQAMTAYRRLMTSVNYLNLNTTDVVLDPDTKNRYFRGSDGESFGLTEQHSMLFTKRPDDQVDMLELAALSVTKPQADSFGVTDIATVLLTIRRFFDESIALAEASTI